ncbi:MAG: hypothetical protein JJ977_18790, partial [Kordiimonadaceae bacterium]|nr:hypothetical protein [Kordiimonadaceae bacterium]
MLAASFELDSQNPVPSITEEMIDRYEQDGVVMLRGALSQEWLMLTELGLGRVLGDAGVTKHTFFSETEGEFQETVRNFDSAFEIRRLMFDS